MSDIDLDYLRERLQVAPFIPFPWGGEDRNIGAFRSKNELIAWYCQPPGVGNQPYRDRGFYTRELAMLSRLICPRTVVEFGTCQGIGTCLLHWLNPNARLVTVDVRDNTFIPGNQIVPIGHLAKWQRVKCEYVCDNSWEYRCNGVDLCFIDADHDYGPVARDSACAWANKATGHRWAIAWHDYNSKHPGVVLAVSEFCRANGVVLQSRPDSDTVWITGDR